ncbi:hypothetical protein LNP74_02335 [Klebsiella pneumoniae subsp. pneumoniae]|nr:hypothetical protein [Klebsiella pneumoniae subsp. pneumoniae]
MTLLVIAVIGYALSALSWNYSSLMVARFISGLHMGHGMALQHWSLHQWSRKTKKRGISAMSCLD